MNIADCQLPIADFVLFRVRNFLLQFGRLKRKLKFQSAIGNWQLAIGNAMNQDDLKKRTKLFALRILKLVAALPNTVIGRTIGGQLARAGTSVGSNYRAACRSRSKAEFIAKIGVVEEEADESGFWLEMIIESELVKKSLVEPLLQESIELTKIMASSRKSAKETDSR